MVGREIRPLRARARLPAPCAVRGPMNRMADGGGDTAYATVSGRSPLAKWLFAPSAWPTSSGSGWSSS